MRAARMMTLSSERLLNYSIKLVHEKCKSLTQCCLSDRRISARLTVKTLFETVTGPSLLNISWSGLTKFEFVVGYFSRHIWKSQQDIECFSVRVMHLKYLNLPINSHFKVSSVLAWCRCNFLTSFYPSSCMSSRSIILNCFPLIFTNPNQLALRRTDK